MIPIKNTRALSAPSQPINPSEIKSKDNNNSGEKVHHIWINRHSERETSRYLAAICDLLLQSLNRDFNMGAPKTIVIRLPDRGGIRIEVAATD